MDRNEIQAYQRVRDLIFDGNLKIVREEFLSLLSRLFIYQLSKAVDGLRGNEDLIDELLSYQRDFQDFDKFKEDVNKAVDYFRSGDLNSDGKIKKLKEILRSPSSTNFLQDSILELSNYGYEVLITFLERENVGIVKEFLFSMTSPEIKLLKEIKNRE